MAVYGLAIYCPNCSQLAPAQQFGELIRIYRDAVAALASLPAEIKRGLAESGVLGANFENTIKDGFGALETFLRARFEAEAPGMPLQGKGNVFQRLGDAAELYRQHLDVNLPALLGTDGWEHLNQVAAMRHVLVHNAGIVDAGFLDRLPRWPQQAGQRIQIKKSDADEFITCSNVWPRPSGSRLRGPPAERPAGKWLSRLPPAGPERRVSSVAEHQVEVGARSNVGLLPPTGWSARGEMTRGDVACVSSSTPNGS